MAALFSMMAPRPPGTWRYKVEGLHPICRATSDALMVPPASMARAARTLASSKAGGRPAVDTRLTLDGPARHNAAVPTHKHQTTMPEFERARGDADHTVSRQTVLFLSNLRRQQAADEGQGDVRLAHALAQAGFIVSSLPPLPWPLNPLAGKGTFYAGFDPIRALGVLLFHRHVDAVVSVGESNIVLILLLRRLLRFHPPILLREISGRGWRIRDRIVDFVLPRVDRVLALTPHQKAWAERQFRPRGAVDMVGFAVDEQFFAPQDRPAEDRMEAYVLAVGDDGGRDYPTLLAACRATPFPLKLRANWGSALPDDMLDRITVLGRASSADLRGLYEGAAVVAIPLQDVDYPSGVTTLFEAMAMGCAVVATDIGSTRHVIESGRNGVLVPAGDAGSLRDAIVMLLADAALRQRLGRAARATIAEGDFSYDAYAQRFIASLRAAKRETRSKRFFFEKKQQKTF
jgi:glycosyltransferase involved in cell wall biosynthesis